MIVNAVTFSCRSRSAIGIVVTLSLIAFASSGHAQAPEDDSGLRANCVGDYFRFCTAYAPGSVAIRQCFGRNFPQLTSACQGAIRAFDGRADRRRS